MSTDPLRRLYDFDDRVFAAARAGRGLTLANLHGRATALRSVWQGASWLTRTLLHCRMMLLIDGLERDLEYDLIN